MKKRILGVLVLILAAAAPASAELPWLSSALRTFLDSSDAFVAGWSKKGAAVVLAPVDGGGRGGPAVRLLLIDTVEDTVLAEDELWADDFEDAGYDSAALAVAMAASPAIGRFLDHCVDAAIVPLDVAAAAQSFPLSFQGSSFTAKVVTTARSAKDEVGSRALDYRVVVSSARGDKTVASGKLAHAYDMGVGEYFLSPWEPRMLVVSWYTEPGFEGEQPRTYFFSGCLLTAGFKKP